METEQAFQALCKKYLEGTCSPGEVQQLEKWYSEKANTNSDPVLRDDMWEDDTERFLQTLISEKEQAPRKIKWNWRLRIFLAAALIILIGSLSIVLLKRTDSAREERYANTIEPGGNKATITLENGKKIQLSDDRAGVVVGQTKLTYDDGSLINQEKVQRFTISTPMGGTYKVRLPDGSEVWLNAGSSLTYDPASNEQQRTRNVELSGEAYFEVAKDTQHPFIVTTEKQKLEVLGTHFNISAYKDERSVMTTLIEGSVKVSPLKSVGTPTKSVILRPNQQSVVNSAGLHVRSVDPADLIAWKNGEFFFINEELESIMRKVARWYNVEVIYTDQGLRNKVFSGFVSRYDKVSGLLTALEATGDLKFKIDGRSILVMQAK